MNSAQYIDVILQELEKAENKYPDFVNKFLHIRETTSHIETMLAMARSLSNEELTVGYSVQATLNEEILEAYEAYAHGEYWHCMQELAQVAAVAIRAMAWLNKKHGVKPNEVLE